MKVVLTIAGSDSSGGAGIQADLKTFEAFGLFGTTALTVLTAQNTEGVNAIEPLPATFVTEQLEAVRSDFTVAAVKIGMLYSIPIINAVKEFLATLSKDIPVVFDPVCISKAGSPLLQDDAVDALRSLLPFATVVTPSRYEAARLFDYRYECMDAVDRLKQLPCPVLVKGEDLERNGTQLVVDRLYYGELQRVFTAKAVETTNLHGTGCSFSSAIAANLALGLKLEPAIERSKNFITAALEHAPAIGHGPGPINHKEGGIHVAKA
jgi:hydroxymethylpyrimidine/phosphomethylpyrimidine kinase